MLGGEAEAAFCSKRRSLADTEGRGRGGGWGVHRPAGVKVFATAKKTGVLIANAPPDPPASEMFVW